MSDWYILNESGDPIPSDAVSWSAWSIANSNRVALDHVGPYRISTVFLGLDHRHGNGAPLLFETLVFEGDGYAEIDGARYTFRDDAMEGHKRLCETFRAKLS